MGTYVKRAGAWDFSSNVKYVKRAGVWDGSPVVAGMYVKRAGVWEQETTGSLLAAQTQYRRYGLTFPGTLTAQASTAQSVADRLDEATQELVAYSLPGDGSIIIDVVGTQASATALTNRVKALLEPWSSVASLGAI